MSRKVRKERTGWRDKEMSDRHRLWGWDCPAIDIDFLMIEYDRARPVALVEYKHERAKQQFATKPSFRALVRLGDAAGLPVLACRYADDFSWWLAVPLNDHARAHLPKRIEMTEEQWVGLLYRLRGRPVPPDLFEHNARARVVQTPGSGYIAG